MAPTDIRRHQRDEAAGPRVPCGDPVAGSQLERFDLMPMCVPQGRLAAGYSRQEIFGQPGERGRPPVGLNRCDRRERLRIDDPNAASQSSRHPQAVRRDGPETGLLRQRRAVLPRPAERYRVDPRNLIGVGLADPESPENGVALG